MNIHDLAWYCAVALVYLLTFVATSFLLVADWRLMNGSARVPWPVVFGISLLGPIGLLVAFTVYSLDKVRHGS